MAPSISTLKKQSHPFFTRAPFDVSSPKTPVIAAGSTYGQLPADSGVTFNDPATGQEISMKVHLLGYGSASMTLTRDYTYLLSGRLICPNIKTPPVLYYDQDLTFPMGATDELAISLSNKTAVWGFGIIISKHEREDNALGQPSFQSLFVVMRHTDYDNQSKTQVTFNVSYKIPGNRNLGKTFGLFQPGREMLLSGTLIGYDKTQRMLQVQALSVSLSSGIDPVPASGSESDKGRISNRKHYQINFDSDEDCDSAPAQDANPSSTPGTETHGPTDLDPLAESPVPGNASKRKYTKKVKLTAPNVPVAEPK